LIIGSTINNAGTQNTVLTTNSTVAAFELLQNGQGTALMGYVTPATGMTRGVYGRTDSPNGDGVQARNGGAFGTGAAVRALGGSNYGVYATSASHVAVYGETDSFYGVHGSALSGNGIIGTSSSGYGVYGSSSSSFAGYFSGPVNVTGLLTKGGGGFKIDHPLDPAGKYLQHSFVESPDMKNVYDGVVRLDAGGEATVELPAYFGILNRDLRYQLTALGSGAPDLHVKSEVADGRFMIAGGRAGQQVCWQVTGIRDDPFAKQHPIVVEEAKGAADNGTYLHPELYRQPTHRSLDHRLRPAERQPAVAG
jgi:hypothetical protein